MTDIVERLRKTASRGVSVWGDLQMEAADVIDTLRARLAQQDAEPVAGLEVCQHRQGRADWNHWECADCGWIRPGGPTRGPDAQGFFPSMAAVKEYDKFKTYPGMGEVLPMIATPQAPIDGFGGNLDSAFDAPAPDLKHCACEFDGDTCVSQCKLHAAHVDAIHEWAERAKEAEAKLAAQPAPAPVVPAVQPLTDEQIWCNDSLMAINGRVGLNMAVIMEFVRAIEQAHGIGTQGQSK